MNEAELSQRARQATGITLAKFQFISNAFINTHSRNVLVEIDGKAGAVVVGFQRLQKTVRRWT